MSTLVSDYGQIKSMSLPAGWLEYEHESQPSSPFYLREFSAPGNPEVKIAFYYRGRRVDARSAEAFHNTLSAEMHDLTSSELEALALVLRNMAEDGAFETERARTADLNGRRVLTVQGLWTASALKSCAIFVDAEGDGEIIQEIYYVAPDMVFDRFAGTATAALRSIEWKGAAMRKR